MLSFKLAWRNLAGSGLRSWLNVFILSVVLVTIIGFHGLYIGWQRDAEGAMMSWHIADGQYWQKNYEPEDVFSYEQSSAVPASDLNDEQAVGYLVSQGVIYPQGSRQNVVIKGVEAEQNILEMPTEYLRYEKGKYKMMLGIRQAKRLKLQEGDRVMLRWRDVRGSFDAREFEIVHIFTSTVSTIDRGQVWLGLRQLQEMLKREGELTYFSFQGDIENPGKEWVYRSTDKLLADFRAVYATELAGGIFVYILLLFLAMIAIFDTQVLAMFKRRREIGMMMAMGMPRWKIITTFTLEGLLCGFLAVIAGAVWGTPLLKKFQESGLKLPEAMENYGMDGLLDAMYPYYTWQLVVVTVIIIMLILLIVSFLPVSSISRLNPVKAMK